MGASPTVAMQQGEDYSMPFHLARQGYDVWLVMSKGSPSGRAHVDASPDGNPETCLYADPYNNPCDLGMFSTHDYFNTTFDEAGDDILKAHQYIAEQTGFRSTPIVCMSTSCNFLTSAVTLHADYFNDAATVIIEISPLIDRHSSPSFMDMSIPLMAPGLEILDEMGFALVAQGDTGPAVQRAVCEYIPLFCTISRFGVLEYNIMGYETDWAVDTITVPGGGMLITWLLQVNQQIQREGFNRYNYGPEENMRRYGSLQAPTYPFEDLNAPVALFFATDDAFISARGREVMTQEFGENVVFSQLYPVAHTWM
jgi:hypothetical protein